MFMKKCEKLDMKSSTEIIEGHEPLREKLNEEELEEVREFKCLG